MALEEYARKRRFTATPEPKPAPAQTAAGPSLTFCVQRHAATRLHYDFRLEMHGVLVSWAVPKGPSLDPARKALAMKVEDHPLDYGGFEGNIPAGNYGAGSVMLWDRGTYEVLGDLSPEEQLARGDLKFFLQGAKLKGSFAIVRMKRAEKGNEWLLIKKPDDHAVKDWDIEKLAWSVVSRRTQEQIAGNEDPAGPAATQGAKKARMPAHLEPMMATGAKEPPSGPPWWYEVKWDGVRALCFVADGQVRMESRNGNRCDQQYPELAELTRRLQAETAIVDAEITVLDERGQAHFANIQPRIHANAKFIPGLVESAPATLFLFDLLYLDGVDLRGAALEDRKRLLATVLQPSERIRLSEHFQTDPHAFLAAAGGMGIEGIIAKDRTSRYESKRSGRWLKIKVVNEQEFVIAGFTKGEREHFGALILAVRDGDRWRHVGQCGTGFDENQMRMLARRMNPLISDRCPLTPKPRLKGAVWLRLELVCQVRFQEWTPDHMLRAAVYAGLREDKPVAEVVQEPAAANVPAPAPVNGFSLKGREATVTVDGHPLKLTNLKKVYYPNDGYTKCDLLEYYHRVAPLLLPHLRDRPLSLRRYPNGIHDESFFQKNAAEHFPEWIPREAIQDSADSRVINYVIANDEAALLYLVNLGCIDHNPFMSRTGSLDRPDFVLIDLDPVECPYDMIVEAALVVKRIVTRLGLRSYVKTTGGDGMHLYIPLAPEYTFDQARSFAEILAQLAIAEAEHLFTTPRSVGKRRKGRVYFDWQQIASGKTIASVYSARAFDGAPVSTPLEWSEVKPGLDPRQFTIRNAIARFERTGDLFEPVLSDKQRLEGALRRLKETVHQ